MRLAVAIPARNEADRVARAVASAWALGSDPVSQEAASAGPLPSSASIEVVSVVVADGQSEDQTRQCAAEAGAEVVQCQPGRGGQLRAAVGAALGARPDVLLLLHADSWLDRAAGGQLAAWFAASSANGPRTQYGAFRQRIDDPRRVFRWVESGNALRARRMRLPYGDQALFVRTEALGAVGGVPDLPLMEDVALAQGLRRAGFAGPELLDGPVHVSARRWLRHGVVRQTLRNWSLLAAFAMGVSAERLVKRYAPHETDRPSVDRKPRG